MPRWAHRALRPARSPGSRLHRLRRDLAAAAAVTRYRSGPAEPRAVRLAAIGLGVILLMGAIATYLILTAVVGPPTEVPRPAATPGSAAAQAGAWDPGRR